MKRPTLFEQWECQGLPGLPFEPETARPTGQPEARSLILGQPERPIFEDQAQNDDSSADADDFECDLRNWAVPYVAVTEARKAIFAGGDIDEFDFLVYSATGPNHLVLILDGGQEPTGHQRDVMDEWGRIFGEGFEVRFVRWSGEFWECRKLNETTWTEYRVDNDEPGQH